MHPFLLQQQLRRKAAAAPAPTPNPLWPLTISLLRCQGDDDSTTFTDEVSARAWTASGSTKIITSAPSKFGSTVAASVMGGAGQLAHAAADAWNFGTDDFTIEGWFYTDSETFSVNGSAGLQDMVTTNKLHSLYMDNPTIGRVLANQANVAGLVNLALPANTWFHYALSRVDDTLGAYVAGTRVGYNGGLGGISVMDATSQPRYFGNASHPSWRGYAKELRVLRGVGAGIYTGATITVPTAPFPGEYIE